MAVCCQLQSSPFPALKTEEKPCLKTPLPSSCSSCASLQPWVVLPALCGCLLPPSLTGLSATTTFWGPGVLLAHWGPSRCLRLSSCGRGRAPGLGGNSREFLYVKVVRQNRVSALENFLPRTKRLKWVKTLSTVPCCQQLQVKCCFCSASWKDYYVPKLNVSRSTHLQWTRGGKKKKKKTSHL